jgi:pimeloyl-ACP methyl ester carboxylesterase
METLYTSIQDVNTFVRILKNQGPQTSMMIIFHGWNTNGGGSWEPFLHELSRKFPHTTFVAPDLPGMGKSSSPDSVWGVEEYVLWAEELSLTYKKAYQKFIVVGHSFGGVLVAQLATKKSLNLYHLLLLAPAIIREK